jgi:hypothetical protein
MNRPRQHAPALLYLLNLTSIDGGNAILLPGASLAIQSCAEPHAGWCGGWRLDSSGYPIKGFYFSAVKHNCLAPSQCHRFLFARYLRHHGKYDKEGH